MIPAEFVQSVAMLCLLVSCEAHGGTDRARTASDSIGARSTASRSEDPASFMAPPSRSGDLTLNAKTLTFTPCREDGASTPVEDLPTGEGRALIGELGGAARRVAVLVRLAGARIVAIRHAAPEGRGCDALSPEGEVEARGNEPFWVVRVEGGEARVLTPESPAGTDYHHGTWARSGDSAWVYRARSRGDETDSLTLRLTTVRCIDNMSGAWYPFGAALSRGGSRVTGCALEGRQSQRPAAER